MKRYKIQTFQDGAGFSERLIEDPAGSLVKFRDVLIEIGEQKHEAYYNGVEDGQGKTVQPDAEKEIAGAYQIGVDVKDLKRRVAELEMDTTRVDGLMGRVKELEQDTHKPILPDHVSTRFAQDVLSAIERIAELERIEQQQSKKVGILTRHVVDLERIEIDQRQKFIRLIKRIAGLESKVKDIEQPSMRTRSAGLDDLKDVVDDISKLLADPQSGMATWHMLLSAKVNLFKKIWES